MSYCPIVSFSSSSHCVGLREYEDFSIFYHTNVALNWPRETHSQVEVLVPLEEIGATLILAGKVHTLKANQAYLIAAQAEHQLSLERSGELVMIFLERQFINRVINSAHLNPNWQMRSRLLKGDRVIQFVAQGLCEQTKEKVNPISQFYSTTLVQLLVIHLMTQYADTTPIPMPLDSGLACSRIAPSLAYIHSNLGDELKVSTLADMSDLSAPHFCRIFKRTTGLSPRRYIIFQRINHAKKLLKKTNLSLSDIALRCGFYDQSHFNFQFRSLTGMTPRIYCQQNRRS